MEAEATSTSLDNRVRQVVILTVGAVWKSAYELYAHSAEGRHVGLPDEVIEALVAGQIPDQLFDDEKLAARFAQQLTVERRVDSALYAAAERAYGQRGLVDLTLLVGYFHTTCALLNAFDIPAPPASDRSGQGTPEDTRDSGTPWQN
jgi:4-carboxymuconolactone decarboxylase